MDNPLPLNAPALARPHARSGWLTRLRIEHLWLLLPLAGLAWMGLLHPLRLLDFWWHLKVGEIIVTTRTIPTTDLFSFTFAGRPFLHQNWLAEVLYYLAYRAGGLPLLIAGNTVLLLAAFAPVQRLCVRAAGSTRLGSACSLLAMLVLGLYSNTRPQVFSFVLFAAYYAILSDYEAGRGDRLWLLPPGMALWVNLHGAFVLGLGMAALALAAEAARAVAEGPASAARRRAARLALIALLCAAACAVNPEGVRVFGYVRQLQVDPASQTFVTEWQTPDIKDVGDVLLFHGGFWLCLLVLLCSRERPSVMELGLFVAFGVLGLAARRNGVWFALVAAPILARHTATLRLPHLAGLPPRLRAAGRLRLRAPSRGAESERCVAGALNLAIVACLAAFTVLLSPWVRPGLVVERLNRGLVDRNTPVGAMDHIKAQGLQGNIFHPQAYGDYLIWRLWPQNRSFIDGRVHLFSGEFVREYVLTLNDTDWEPHLSKWDIRYLLLPKEDKQFARILEDARTSERWVLLYEDDISALFERQAG